MINYYYKLYELLYPLRNSLGVFRCLCASVSHILRNFKFCITSSKMTNFLKSWSRYFSEHNVSLNVKLYRIIDIVYVVGKTTFAPNELTNFEKLKFCTPKVTDLSGNRKSWTSCVRAPNCDQAVDCQPSHCLKELVELIYSFILFKNYKTLY